MRNHQRLRLLIVEDEDATREALRCVAREMGLEPITHTRASSARDVFQGADMAIFDWHLPDMDTEVLLDLWFRSKDGPVAVLYSEMPDTTHARLLTRCTTWNVFPQPPSYDTLQDVARVLLKRYKNSVQVQQRLNELESRVRTLTWALVGTIVGFFLSTATVLVLVLRSI